VASRDRRRTDIARFLETVQSFGAPAGNAAEQTIWIHLARHGTKDGATKALAAIRERFVDVNEFRVAKVTEIADLIRSHVKNDPIAVAEHARGFLRRFYKDHHNHDFAVVDPLNADALRKYLTNAEDSGQEMALALLLHFLQQAAADEAAADAPPEAEGAKPRRRPEKDLTQTANRLRMLFTLATLGPKARKTAPVPTGKRLVGAWAFRALPKPEPVALKPAARKASGTRRAATGGTASKTKKKTAGRTTKSGSRPATGRTTRSKAPAKKSSRR